MELKINSSNETHWNCFKTNKMKKLIELNDNLSSIRSKMKGKSRKRVLDITNEIMHLLNNNIKKLKL